MDDHQIIFRDHEIGPWTVPTIVLADAAVNLHLHVSGTIINSITDGQRGRERQQIWKASVASHVKEARGATLWHPCDNFAISLGLSFHIRSHGNQKSLDVENFIKPIIDALAAGLFCTPQEDPRNIEHWNYDDSNFNTLLVRRLPDAAEPSSEGICLFVSSRS